MPSHWVPSTIGVRRIKRLLTVVIMAFTAMLAAASPAAAGSPQGDSGLLDASQRVAGFTAGALLGEEYRQLLELPEGANPLAGKGDNCLSAGHRDKVLILFTVTDERPPADCTVTPGTPVFFSSLVAECSSVEPSPFRGATEKEQRQCALGFLRDTPFGQILVSIDGGAAVNIGLRRYLSVARQGTVKLPESNILGVSDLQATFVAAGYSALLRPLSRGTHTISVTVVTGPYAGTNRAVVHVTSDDDS